MIRLGLLVAGIVSWSAFLIVSAVLHISPIDGLLVWFK